MILRHAGALDWAMGRKVRMLLSPRKEFPTANRLFAPTDQDDETHIVNIDRILGIDNSSGDTEPEEAEKLQKGILF